MCFNAFFYWGFSQLKYWLLNVLENGRRSKEIRKEKNSGTQSTHQKSKEEMKKKKRKSFRNRFMELKIEYISVVN